MSTDVPILDDLQRGIVYLACPYTHENDSVMEWRASRATELATWLTRRGVTVFSPLTQSREMERMARLGTPNPLPTSYQFWKRHDRKFVEVSTSLLILTLDGWAESVGVNDEIHRALDYSLPIFLARELDRASFGEDRYELKRAPYSVDSRQNEVSIQGNLFTKLELTSQTVDGEGRVTNGCFHPSTADFSAAQAEGSADVE